MKLSLFGYNRRIRRARSYFINPFPSRSSVTNIFQGNPNIDPTYSNGIDLGYLKRYNKTTLNGSVYLRKSTGEFTFITENTGDYVLVNNAAHDDRHKWQDVTEEYWDERFATNLRHHFFTIQSVAKDMIKKGEGSIVNIGSNSWWEAVGNFPAYATAKSAVHGLSRTLARDLGQHRIRVNTVVPGWDYDGSTKGTMGDARGFRKISIANNVCQI